MAARGASKVKSPRFRSQEPVSVSPIPRAAITAGPCKWRCEMATVNPTQGLQGAEKFVKKASGLYMRWRWRSSFSGPWRSLSPELRVLAVAVLVGWLLIFGGGAHLVAAFSGGAAGRA